jgi:insulysin
MLFLGTSKYGSDYDEYISERGGSSNAYTDMEDTNYYFGVMDGEGFEGALDRLGQFFISPLFNESSISSELLAVDSEYSNSLTSDNWRQFQLSKHLSNPNHPYSKFGCGNYFTLTSGGDRKVGLPSSGSSPRPSLLEFWERYYHASNFALCCMSRLPLPELEKAVIRSFGAVREKPSGWKRDSWGVEVPWGPSETGVVREYVPVKDIRKVSITFPIPALSDASTGARRVKPHRVISHLVGYEGSGSFREALVKEGWGKGVTAGVGTEGEGFCTFSVTVGLTTEGSNNTDEVVGLFWKWLKLIKDNREELKQYHEEQCKVRYDMLPPITGCDISLTVPSPAPSSPSAR